MSISKDINNQWHVIERVIGFMVFSTSQLLYMIFAMNEWIDVALVTQHIMNTFHVY